MKPDERDMLRLLQSDAALRPFEAAERVGMYPKRAERVFEKWTGKGWLESGVSNRTGWLTETGRSAPT